MIPALVAEDVFEGACYGHDPEIWFPSSAEELDEALSICKGCPVREDCLAGALDRSEPFGVWGGKTEEERKVLEDGYKPCPCGRTRIKKSHHACLLCQQAKKRKRDAEALASRRLGYAEKKRRAAG